MERLKPNQIRRLENRSIAHGVRIAGTVYFNGEPRISKPERRQNEKNK